MCLMFYGGGVYAIESWSFILAASLGTDRYEDQPESTEFGLLTIMYKY
jgi:hypothetical protein